MGLAPGVRLPGTFMYSCTVFMPRMVWPTWLSMFPVDVTRMKAGSFSNSCSWGFHLWWRGCKSEATHSSQGPPQYSYPSSAGFHPTYRLASDRSILVPNLMI